MDANSTLRMVNLTGATFNQFGNNAITGTTITGQTTVTIPYANSAVAAGNSSINAVIQIIQPEVSQFPVPGNPAVEQGYLQYPTDTEYFQLLTGLTVSDFINISQTSTSGYYPNTYLLHDV
jgi:hypothetical protein